MKPEHELALQELRAEQSHLHRRMQGMDEGIQLLAVALKQEAVAPQENLAKAATAPRSPARPVNAEPAPVAAEPIDPRSAPKPPPEIRESFAKLDFKRRKLVEPSPAVKPLREEPAESMEITFGRVWLVRIGVVILLTGLVFLGNLAYQHIIPRLGAGAKLSIIYLAGFAMSAAGIFLERTRESLRNYARVVLAGGCATIYYATYAAHFVEPLRVIESPLLAGTLLLGLAVAIGVAADRRKSETLALVALVLSYYTSGLNPIGNFTLFSSFLLAGTAVFFLLRHRWVRLTTASLAGTYLSYLWCRHLGGASPAVDAAPLASVTFLGGYWVMFTAGGFLAKQDALGSVARTQLLTVNNAAFAILGAFEIAAHRPDDAWAFALIFGLVLLGLSRLARQMIPDSAAVDGAYCVQGLALTTLGLALKLTGEQLALALAAQSVLMLAGAGRIPTLRLIASLLSAAGAAGLAGFAILVASANAAAVGGFVVIALVAVAWLYRRRSEIDEDEISALPLVVVSAALVLSVGALWRSAGWPPMIGWMAVGAVLCAVIPRRLGVRELTFASQALLTAGTALWVGIHAATEIESITEPLALILGGGFLSLWWGRQSRIPLDATSREVLEGSPAFSAGVVALVWTTRAFPGTDALAAASLLGCAWFAISLALRARFLTGAGLAFTFLAALQFVRLQSTVHWAVALLPIAHLLSIAAMGRWIDRLGESAAAFQSAVTNLALGLASVMAVLWTFAHIDREWHALFFAAAGAISALAGARSRQQSLSYTGLGLGAFAWILAVVIYQSEPIWQHLAAIMLFPAVSRMARKLWENEPTRELAPILTWASMAGMTLWAHRWCDLHVHHMSLTIIWTLVALLFFGAGLLLPDRHYRLGGLGLLGLSVARVFFVDVWAFDPVLRILSFIILGTVLLVVGYCYNRFEEKLQRWL